VIHDTLLSHEKVEELTIVPYEKLKKAPPSKKFKELKYFK
jgi:hypothetical protein